MPLPSQVQLSNTFGQWVNTTNQIITAVGNTSEYILVAQNATPATSSGNVSINGTMTIVTVTANGTVTANVFSGNGVSLTTMNASALATGTVPDGRLSGTYTLITANNSTYAFGKSEGALNVNSATTATQATNATNLNSQPGSYYTNASNLATGTLAIARLDANVILTTSTTGMNASALSTGTVPLSRLTSANSSANGVVDTTTQTFVGNKTFNNDLTVSGNLTVLGTTTTVSANNLIVDDSLIQLAANNTTSDALDIGLFGNYNTNGGAHEHAGLFRDATDGTWRLFVGLQEAPVTTVNTAGTGYGVGTLVSYLSSGILTTNATQFYITANSSCQANLAVNSVSVSGWASASTLNVTGATTLDSTLLCSGVATVNAKMTLNTTNGRFVLPVGTNLWAT